MGNITAGQIVVGGGNKLWLNDANDGGLRIGGSNKGGAPFRVDADGTLEATSGIIGGVQIQNTALVAGGVTLNGNGITVQAAGPNDPSNAYKFSNGGKMYAEGSDLYVVSPTGTSALHFAGATVYLGANAINLLANTTVQGTLNGSGDAGFTGNLYAYGIASRNGTGGSWNGNMNNFNWAGGGAEYWVNGSFIGYLSYITSDARLKRDLGVVPDGLEAVLRLQPRAFEWLDADLRPGGGSVRPAGVQYGLMAQDVAAVLPVVARHMGTITPATPDGMWTVDYFELVPVLVKAIQELEARVRALEARR